MFIDFLLRVYVPKDIAYMLRNFAYVCTSLQSYYFFSNAANIFAKNSFFLL
jgi:hypothetical protein